MFFTIGKIEKLLQEIRAAIAYQSLDIPRFKFYAGDCPGAQTVDFDDSAWDEFQTGGLWGGYDQIAWFRARLAIPAEWRDQKLVLRFLVGPRDGYASTAETQLYVNGFPLQAIDVWHEQAWLPPEYARQDQILVALRAWSGMYQVPPQRRFKEARLVWVDEATESFYYLAATLLKAIKQLDENSLDHVTLLDRLHHAFLQIDFIQPRSPAFYRSVAAANAYLRVQLEGLHGSGLKHSVNAIGHSHIDMAWMWQSRHTREKARRTFSTMLHLMRQYPEFCYIHSSPQLYKFVKQDDPALYARIRAKVASGQWEATGGMWVESDTNIPGGESLVRQILFGQRFFRQEFGRESKVLWMPDTFGFSWVLPQLMKLSGLEYFASSAIHWSRFTRFPHDTFHWRGLDGSQVLVTFFTAPGETIKNHYNYNSLIAPYDVQVAWEHYRQKAINQELLMPFGWGDGGGGPTQEMIESIRAQADLPGLGRVQTGKVEPYFERLAARLEGQDVPVWDGELYKEATRGVYTSQARNKRANRQAEILYHNAEWLCALVDVLTGEGLYPQAALNRGWEMILHNQFHDVLPGTSIPAVVVDSLAELAQAAEIGRECLRHAESSLLANLCTQAESLVVFNPLGWERGGLVELPWSGALEGKTLSGSGTPAQTVQPIVRDGQQAMLFEVDGIPSLGYRTFELVPDPQPGSGTSLRVAADLLESPFFRVKFNQRGQISSIYDKQNRRDVLPPGGLGNVLQLFEDRSMHGEAWEIDLYYQDKAQAIENLTEAVVEESGPLRATLRLSWQFASSRLTQRISVYRSSPRIDFRSELDWHEHQVLLKAAFPVDVRATMATYEIQFGNLARPTHWNTPHDLAHYENPAQKWVDLSEGNYGAALLNECKYGYDVKDNVLRLTLHRAPTEPDPGADQGLHTFNYSLLPHAGTWRESAVIAEAYTLNQPLWGALLPPNPSGSLPLAFALARLDCDHVILETVKKAEDEPAWIVRLYECKQMRNPAVRLTFGRAIERAVSCDLLEGNESPASFVENQLVFAIAPYEIKTFKVWL